MVLDHSRWLGIAREAAAAASAAVDAFPFDERDAYTGSTGAGGDRTLAIDAAAEDAIISVLRRHSEDGLPSTVISEERGEVDLGAPVPRLLVDPIDGSLNAGRGGAGHHAVSIAIASGPSIADVEVGYILDLSTGQEWWAIAGSGAFLDGRRLGSQHERRTHDGKLELLAIEAADPQLVAPALPVLTDEVRRLRCLGAIALGLCQLASGAVDAMLTLGYCRPVDAAAGQLLVRETGGLLEWWPGEPLSDVPLTCDPRSALVAGRSPESVAALRGAVAHVVMPTA
ncbi:MAG: inositol monophosphatase family protein [Solirubrobacteraceae bacterium]|nr:inositol monophosphatase family protein [Solirubrobacteraceae bacterium]